MTVCQTVPSASSGRDAIGRAAERNGDVRGRAAVVDGVHSLAAVEDVAALGRHQPVVAAQTGEPIGTYIARQLVGEPRAFDMLDGVEPVAGRVAAIGFARGQIDVDARIRAFVGGSRDVRAEKVVGPGSAFEDVVAEVAVKEVVAVAALDDVVASITPEVIVEWGAGDVFDVPNPVAHDVFGACPIPITIPGRRMVREGDHDPIDPPHRHQAGIGCMRPEGVQRPLHGRRVSFIGHGVGAGSSIDIVHEIAVVVAAGLQAGRIAVLLHQKDVVAVLAEAAVDAAVEDDDVVAVAAVHPCAPAVSGPGIVVARAADDVIVACSTHEAVTSFAPEQDVIAVAAVQGVIAIAPLQPVPTGRSGQVVAIPRADDDIVAAGMGDSDLLLI